MRVNFVEESRAVIVRGRVQKGAQKAFCLSYAVYYGQEGSGRLLKHTQGLVGGAAYRARALVCACGAAYWHSDAVGFCACNADAGGLREVNDTYLLKDPSPVFTRDRGQGGKEGKGSKC